MKKVEEKIKKWKRKVGKAKHDMDKAKHDIIVGEEVLKELEELSNNGYKNNNSKKPEQPLKEINQKFTDFINGFRKPRRVNLHNLYSVFLNNPDKTFTPIVLSEKVNIKRETVRNSIETLLAGDYIKRIRRGIYKLNNTNGNNIEKDTVNKSLKPESIHRSLPPKLEKMLAHLSFVKPKHFEAAYKIVLYLYYGGGDSSVANIKSMCSEIVEYEKISGILQKLKENNIVAATDWGKYELHPSLKMHKKVYQ